MASTARLPATPPHTLLLVVYGTPAPQGSKKAVGRPGARPMIVDDNAASLRLWRQDVKLAALDAMAQCPDWDRSYPAIIGHFTFTLARPKSHHVAADDARELRLDAPKLHTSRPDLDKLLRSTWDALTAAGAYADDARLAQVWAQKAYTTDTPDQSGALDRPGARIILSGARR